MFYLRIIFRLSIPGIRIPTWLDSGLLTLSSQVSSNTAVLSSPQPFHPSLSEQTAVCNEAAYLTLRTSTPDRAACVWTYRAADRTVSPIGSHYLNPVADVPPLLSGEELILAILTIEKRSSGERRTLVLSGTTRNDLAQDLATSSRNSDPTFGVSEGSTFEGGPVPSSVWFLGICLCSTWTKY